MRKIFSRENWEFYFEHPAVRWNVCYIVLLTIIGLILGFMDNWITGLIVLVIAVIGGAISIRRLRKLVVDAHEYLNELTYKVQRGQQEALLEMPIGMIMLNKRHEVEWINPYMARYFNLEIVVGKPIADVDVKLAELIKDHADDKQTQVVTWRDHQFEFLVQHHGQVVYLLDITKYEQISAQYKDEQIFIGNIYLDNYDELIQGMSDSDVSNLHNYVTSQISDWAVANHLLMKIIDDDNYLIIGHQASLKELEKQKFKILDVIRE